MHKFWNKMKSVNIVCFIRYGMSILLFSTLCYFIGCDDKSVESKPILFPKAEAQHINERQLEQAFDDAAQIASLQGLAVARNGVIVAEAYYHGASEAPDSDMDVRSVTKSYLSALVGIAIDKGFIQSIEQTVSDFLPEEILSVNPDLGQVSLHQLMTMTCGHAWQELGQFSEFNNFVRAENQLIYILEKSIVNTPGTLFNYSDGAAHLVSIILSMATGMSAGGFANEYLFIPMGLGNRNWSRDKQGHTYGGVGLRVGIHDMIQFGWLYLNDGYCNGNQILSKSWIETSTQGKLSTNNVLPYLENYGYFWWLGHEQGHDFICAMGYGGQFIFVVHDLNLVVCTRCSFRFESKNVAGQNWTTLLNLIINQILPAVYDDMH